MNGVLAALCKKLVLDRSCICFVAILLLLISAVPALSFPSPADPDMSGEERKMLALPGDLVVESVTCPFDSVILDQTGIPVTVRVNNSSNTSIAVWMLQLIFSENTTGDRNPDYAVSGDINPGITIPSGGSADFDLIVDVLGDAVTDRNIRIDAYAFGQRLDDLETVSDSTSSEIVVDQFRAVSYDGNDGTVDWETSWMEEGDSGPGPDEGTVRVMPAPDLSLGLSLMIGGPSFGPGTGASREVDLTGASAARLSFNWQREPFTGFFGSDLLVRISKDGVDWYDLEAIGPGFDSSVNISSFNITQYIGPDTKIRFVTEESGLGRIYIDNVTVHYATDTGAHSWVVLAEGITSVIALFDTRMTADRADDSLMVLREGEVFQLGMDYHVASGAPIADIPFEKSARYRLVIQLRSYSNWDWAPKDEGRGWLALADSTHGIGLLSSMQPGIKEFLVTETVIADEQADRADYVVGTTHKSGSAVPWSMYIDPWADPLIDEGKIGEYGRILFSLDPACWHVDCRDGGENWEITGQMESDRYYFHEMWFTPDLEWQHGDDADVQLMIQGEPDKGDIPGFHSHFRMIDDDTMGPSITDFTPELVREGEIFRISCRIFDESGVFDDASGSSGQGIYLIWDTDGDLGNGHNEVQMSNTVDDIFSTDIVLSGFTEGDEIIYAVFAHDDDADTGPGDRSLTVSGIQRISVFGTTALFDEPYSLWPDFVYPAEQSVPFYIDLTNPNPGGMRLWTSSFITFTDGSDTVKAFLSNETLIDAGVSGFPVRFDNVDIPASFGSPDTVAMVLFMEGLYDGSATYTQKWTASYTNRLTVREPAVHFDAKAVPSGPVNPGDRLVELLRMEVACESVTDITIDSLIVSDLAPDGARNATDRDGNIKVLYLYRQASPAGTSMILEKAAEDRLDGMPEGSGWVSGLSSLLEEPHSTEGVRELLADRPFSASDSLVAKAFPENGKALFRIGSGRLLGAWESTYFYVLADIDSFDAVDGDPLMHGVKTPDAVFLTGYAAVLLNDDPLVSAGSPVIDGFMSFQASMVPDIPDTLYSGDGYGTVMAIDIPSNGNTPDVMSGMAVANYGDAYATNVLEELSLWIDDGDGIFSVSSDGYAGDLHYTGDRFEITGLSVPVADNQRLFVTADIGYDFNLPLNLRMGIPEMGIDYVSRNDGPIDGSLIHDSIQVLIRREFINIESLIASSEPAPVLPGDRNVELMALRLTNSTLDQVIVDSLMVSGAADLFTCESSKEITLHLDDGDGIFDADSDPGVVSCIFSGGNGVFKDTGIAIAADEEAMIFVTADFDSSLTMDGDTLSLNLMSGEDIYISAVTAGYWEIDGIFPAGHLNPRITDGMLSHQVKVFPGADSTVTGRREDIQILDFLLPGNGCMEDTLSGISIMNLGTAGDAHIGGMILWKDDGDGLFDPSYDDSVAVLSSLIPQTYSATGLSIRLEGASGTRFFASIDLADGFSNGATIRAGIPRMGIEVVSGNDGPLDKGVFDENTLVIPIPDRITFFASSLDNKRVHAGDSDILNMVIGAFNSYDEPKTLGSIVLLQGGTARTDEITSVRAWVDSDEDGLFDPALDGLILEVVPAGVLIRLENMDFVIDPLKSSLLFITYSLPAYGVRDSVSVDMSVPNTSLIEFNGTDIKVEGDFPLNSAGADFTDGMTAAQIEPLSVDGIRVSPGDLDIPCLSFRIPCNGSESDSFKNFSVLNTGTCLPGVDIDKFKLWMESGGSSGSYDAGEEIMLDLLVWDGSRWSSISGLSVPVECAGLTVHVTADFAPSAVDGRTLKVAVPVNGIEMLSGNDGPLDEEFVSNAEILVTTIPLLVAFDPLQKVTCGQEFDVIFGVSNASDTTLASVEPDSFEWSGDGSITQMTGPLPTEVDLPGSGSSTFTWAFTADSPGRTVFRARAVERGGSAESWFELSDTLVIEEIPDLVNVTLDDLSPVSLNRGHRDATLFEAMLTYGSACSGCASIELSSLEVSFMDGQGLPASVSRIASRTVLEDESMVLSSSDTADSTDASLMMIPSQKVMLQPGDVKTLRFSVDISDTASVLDFRVGIMTQVDLMLSDVNNGRTVAYGGASFPWSTNTVSLKDPVTELTIDLLPSLPPTANRGQEEVEAFDLVLTNNGGISASDISISSIRLIVEDEGGGSAIPGGFLRKFRLQDDLGFAYFTTETFPSPEEILCEFQPELKVSPGMPVALCAIVDFLDEPTVAGCSIILDDSLDVTARDFNSGQPVDIIPGGSSAGFPMTAGPTLFSAPLSGFSASGDGMLPASLVAGMTGIDVINITLTHTGAAGESGADVSAVTMRLLDQAGSGLSPRDCLDEIKVEVADTVAGILFISAADTNSTIKLMLDRPLRLEPAETLDLELKCDLSVDVPPGSFQIMIGAEGIEVSDATDGRIFNVLEGEFPIVSGLCEIVIPSENVGFFADPMLAANTAFGQEAHVFDTHFEFMGTAGGSDILVEGLRLEILDVHGSVSEPSNIVESVRIENSLGNIPIGVLTDSGGMTVSIDEPLHVSGDGAVDLSIFFVLKNDAGSRAFSVRINDPSDVSCSDEATGNIVSVVAEPGTSFPFITSRSALLASATGESFSNYPNPFVPGREMTTVTFYLPEPATVSLEIYTILGRRVARLIESRRLDAGLHQDVCWDGRNSNGDPVISGIYLMVLTTKDSHREESFRRKVSLVR